MNPTPKRIQPTHLEYQDPLTPFAPLFQDVYFSAQAGIEESTHVYIEGTQIKEAIAKGTPSITLAEIGFGVGLNFLLTLRVFLESARPEQTLHYISIEKHPVFKEDLRELYSRFPELAPYAKDLVENYPVLTPGMHSIVFAGGRVRLLLCLGDATEMLSRLEARVNFWYWDGFAPSKNQDAFSPQIFEQVARLSAKGARGASFTAAGWVRRELEAKGFNVRKREGFGKKRECIVAEAVVPSSLEVTPPWFSNQNLRTVAAGEKIGIVGAGLAGSALARELLSRGFEVHVFDTHDVASRASGNSVGLYHVQMSRLPNPLSRLAQASLIHFLQELHELKIETIKGIEHNDPEPSWEKLAEPFENSEYPSDFYQKKKFGIFLPECGIVNPKELCAKRLVGAKLHLTRAVVKVEREVNLFAIQDREGKTIERVNHVVYALGADFSLPENSLEHPLLKLLPVRPIRGQIIEVSPTNTSRKLKHTFVQDGYATPIAPQITGHENHVIGATYQAKEIEEDQSERDTQHLLADAKKKWAPFSELTESSVVAVREGYRLSTPDKLPLIGPVCDEEWMKKNYSAVLRGGAAVNIAPLEVVPGEWMLMALGSRGITFSCYTAKILAGLMCAEPLPVELDLWEHLHSARFFIRKLKKPS